MKRIFVALIAATVAIGSLSFGAVAQAADGDESITLSPVNKHYKLDAGSAIQDKLTIINDGKTDYDFIVYARPYTVTGEAYEPDFTKTADNTDVYQWVQFKQTKYTLKAGQSTDVNYSMQVPDRAKPGGHYGVIFAETQPSGEVEGNAVVRKKRVGSIVYATVKGDFTTKGELKDVSTPFWQLQPPLMSSARVVNDGTTDFTDKTKLTVRDMFGRVKYETEKEYPVLPQTVRKVGLEWKDANWFGLYKVDVSHEFLGKTEQRSGHVLMMPRYIPIVLVVVLAVGAIYAIYRRKKS